MDRLVHRCRGDRELAERLVQRELATRPSSGALDRAASPRDARRVSLELVPGLARRSGLLAIALVSACTSPEDPADLFQPPPDVIEDVTEEPPMPPEWSEIGLGVSYAQVNTGHAILIAYGGYSAKLAYSAAWATELVDAKLGAGGVGHVYAVKGPQDASYSAKEIANSKLRAHLATLPADAPIYIVAHSSGSFVAHELLEQLASAGDTAVLGRIAYANLDGGSSGLTRGIVAALDKITFVYAQDPSLSSGLSQNASSAIAMGMTYAMYGTSQKVVVPMTGCANGAGWCLHDVLITHRPHNPQSYNLALDYTDFVNRPVTTEYLDGLVPVP